MGGVIDSGYKGDVGVILFNNSDVEYQVNVGDRIAQLIVEVCMTPLVKEVYDITEDSTSRGGAGFGSSGV